MAISKLLAKLTVGVIIVFSLLISQISFALTPDGETPAIETICDGLTAAPFGLCNAYCEAMDCDSDLQKSSDQACLKVRESFAKATGGDINDPQLMPCDQITPPPADCPCFSAQDISDANMDVCQNGADDARFQYTNWENNPPVGNQTILLIDNPNNLDGSYSFAVLNSAGIFQCRSISNTTAGSSSSIGPLNVDTDELNACLNILHAASKACE